MAATVPGAIADNKTSIYYVAATGEFGIQPDGQPVGLFDILAESDIFTASATFPPSSLPFRENTANRKSWAGYQENAFNTDYSLGIVAPPNLGYAFLLSNLSLQGSGGFGTPNRDLDLVYLGDKPTLVPPIVADQNFGNRVVGTAINHSFVALAGDAPITWSNLLVSGPGTPANPPTLSPAGAFSWNSASSPLGLYNFDVTATNVVGSDVARLSVNLIAPTQEPGGGILPGAGGDGKTSVSYDPATGNMTIQPDGQPVGLFHIKSASGIFTGTAQYPPGGLGLEVNTSLEKGWAALPASAFSLDLSLGNISPTGLTAAFLLNDLSAVGSGGFGTPNRDFDLIHPGILPPFVVDDIQGGDPGETITHTFQLSAGSLPVEWQDLTSLGPGKPAIAPTLTPDGQFVWDSTGSLPNVYTFRVRANSATGSGFGQLLIGLGVEIGIPEPSTTMLACLALVTLGFVRYSPRQQLPCSRACDGEPGQFGGDRLGRIPATRSQRQFER